MDKSKQRIEKLLKEGAAVLETKHLQYISWSHSNEEYVDNDKFIKWKVKVLNELQLYYKDTEFEKSFRQKVEAGWTANYNQAKNGMTILQALFETYPSTTSKEIKSENEILKLKLEVLIKGGCLIIGFIIIEFIFVIISLKYGNGSNIFQKIISFWPYISVAAVLLIILGKIIFQNRKFKDIDWPIITFIRQDK